MSALAFVLNFILFRVQSNTSNLTGFEDTADFDALMDGPVSDGIAAAGMYGDACSDGDDVDELLRIARGRFSGSAADHIAADSKEDATAAVDYNLYKIFWGIQNFVAGDPIKSAAVTPAVISEFITNADTVMSAFEANAFTDSGLEQSLHSWDQLQKLAILHANRRIQQGPIVNEKQAGTTPTLAHDDSYAGCKYLTSSQLFALQLKDPVIREQLSTQLLMHLHYLRDRLPSGAEELTSVSKMEKRIHAILKKTPPNGSHFLKSLTSLLDREQHWSAWKKKGCLPFERLRQEEQEKLSSRKRKRDSGDACVDRADISAKSFTIQIDSSALQSTLQSISSRIPTFEAHMERYIDAEDPDAGIEEEYHPKNDKIYCWRARRLLANKKLAAFEDMADGDVGKGLKKMQKIINPQQTAVGGTTEAEIKKEDSSAAPVLDGNVITTKIDEE